MKEKVVKSTGNVFEDLELENSPVLLVKAELAAKIADLIKEKRLSQAKAAKLLDIDQPKVSALINGKLSGFSIERLIKFLGALDQDIEISVKHKAPRRRRARCRVK